MSHKLKQFRITEVFHNLGVLAIPLVCTPLLLSIAMAELSPKVPSQNQAAGSSTAKNSSPASSRSATKPPQHQNPQIAQQQWHRQLIHQSLLASNSKTTKANNAITTTGKQHTQQVAKASHATTRVPELEMKIALAKDVNNLEIATSTPGVVLDDAGRVLKNLPAGQGVSASSDGDKIQFAGNSNWAAPTSVWIKPSPGGYVYIGQHWYRGRVRLISQGSSLLAVNHVNLDEYLYSVVGSEMPSQWPLEALKAQAIAARSYALAHYIQPANGFYNMGADEAWQVYKGLDGEAASTHQAVNQTLGEFLSYKGGVVESLYADTDDIVIKAHNGLGMSQTGAMHLAEQGYDYLHILGAYYPGTSLAKLELPKS